MIRLVTFDALYTIVTPRVPIHVKYAQIFEPYLGKLDPNAIKASFKTALRQVQAEQPVYVKGVEGFWGAVIRRTAEGAGAEATVVKTSLPEIVPRLLKAFSSREGYRLYDDVLPTLQRLRKNDVKTALVSNGDSRMLDVLVDLEVSEYLQPVLISENEGIEKPDAALFHLACQKVGVSVSDAAHVGDELECDYYGARRAGMFAFLLRREGPEAEGAHKEEVEDLASEAVRVVSNLSEVADYVLQSSIR